MERNQLEKLFLEGNTPDGLGPPCQKIWELPTRVGGAPPRARPLPRGAPVAPPTYFLHPYIYCRTLKLPEHTTDREFRRQKPP